MGHCASRAGWRNAVIEKKIKIAVKKSWPSIFFIIDKKDMFEPSVLIRYAHDGIVITVANADYKPWEKKGRMELELKFTDRSRGALLRSRIDQAQRKIIMEHLEVMLITQQERYTFICGFALSSDLIEFIMGHNIQIESEKTSDEYRYTFVRNLSGMNYGTFTSQISKNSTSLKFLDGQDEEVVGETKDGQCGVCLANRVRTALVPCGHTLCFGCAKGIMGTCPTRCPLCRGRVSTVNQVFLS